MPRNTTMLDLVAAVADHARNDAEIVATVVYLINSGRVRLCGSFEGASFDLHDLEEMRRRANRAA